MSDVENKINADKKVKIENPKGTITLNEALLILKNKSNLEKMGLRIAAVRDGFKSTHIGNGREKFLLDTVKFQKWVKNNFDSVQNYELISFVAKELNITTAYVYKFIKTHKIKTKNAGGGKGKICVDFAVFKDLFNSKRKKKGK